MSDDQVLHCVECGTSFLWLSAEQVVGARPEICPACRRLVPPPGRQRGIIKWFSWSKGYGFITPAQGNEVFCHRSALRPGHLPARAGQLVEYSLSAGPKGIQAVDLVLLEVG